MLSIAVSVVEIRQWGCICVTALVVMRMGVRLVPGKIYKGMRMVPIVMPVYMLVQHVVVG